MTARLDRLGAALRRLDRLGAGLFVLGLAGLAWAWATSSLLESRPADASILNVYFPALATVAGLGLLGLQRRVALFDLVVAVVIAGLIGNAVLWVGLKGWLDGMIGKPSEVAGPAVVVTIPGFITEGAAGLAANAEIQVKIVARHEKANDEEEVETVSVDATFVGASDVRPGALAVRIERGTGDAALDAFLSALADAERIVLTGASASD